MTANQMRSFAIGLLVAASVCAVVYFSTPGQASVAEKVEPITIEVPREPEESELKSMLADKGYVILTESELEAQLDEVETKWTEQLKEIEKQQEKEQEEKEKEKEKQDDKESEVVYRTMLSVVSGMTSIDVGDALVRANIIESSREFSDEVEKKGLAQNLRPGTYEIDSSMSMSEVISIIFK
ncbi:endolytic transglycosylase MltG [Alkalihalobacillus sp. LMS39]|uniref:endolytic transglycosylase MltG n=1 Tax=Alkalihalobacillus sp. LMS39 TaxID=2924032 RepID=UPI001FB4E10C|nr:endolytic transglycosylase MltG [Alkalihalobacillus sp. LMS39]UOE96179.1 endolytic transglycosylase MltG [Alkalihalobacillus sp. LMS39]